MEAPARGASPAGSHRARGISRGVFDRCSSPSVSARRLAGSMVTTHGVAAPARALERERRRGRRLADAAGAAADHDVPVVDDVGDRRHRAAHVVERGDPEREVVGEEFDLGRTDVGGEEGRQARSAGAAAARPSRARLLGLTRVPAPVRNVGRRDAASSASRRSEHDAGTRRRRPRASPPTSSGGYATVHDDRAERDAGAVLDRVRGVDQLADRRLLRQGHEHHLAARRVGEQLDDVGRLLAGSARPAPRRAGRGPRAGSSPRGRPPVRRDDQIGGAARRAASPCPARGCPSCPAPRSRRRRARPMR